MTTILQDYKTVQQQSLELNKVTDNKKVSKAIQDLLTELNDFTTKYKINAMYRLAIPAKKATLDNSAIEMGKIKMPKTLITFLLTKTTIDKPTNARLLGMLLKHQKFNVVFVGNRLHIKSNAK